MNKERLKEIIKARIIATDEEYNRQYSLYEKDKKYAKPDYKWYDTRIKALNETLQLVGMLEE